MPVQQESVQWLQEQLEEQYGPVSAAIWEGLGQKRVTSLRVNTLKSDINNVSATLSQNGLAGKNVDFYQNAIVLPHSSEEKLRKLSLYEEGGIYLQSLSSMIPPLLIDAQPGEDILDMCAAPGGKTSEIVQLTENRAMITACEPDRIRCDRLRSNLRKLGCERVSIMNKDARQLDDFLKFDRILLDAPCSGSGTLYLGENSSRSSFSKKLVLNSAKLQSQLLKKACNLLKRGGRLVYSTCSLLKQENEEQIFSIIRSGKLRLIPIETEVLKGVPVMENSLPGTATIIPNEHFEGFFISVLEKVG